jgi:hypothetical protein
MVIHEENVRHSPYFTTLFPQVPPLLGIFVRGHDFRMAGGIVLAFIKNTYFPY